MPLTVLRTLLCRLSLATLLTGFLIKSFTPFHDALGYMVFVISSSITPVSYTHLDECLRMVFLHELSHYKRGDLWVKAFSLAIAALHWFNPLCYILVNAIDKQCELALDERLIQKMSHEDVYKRQILCFPKNSN